MKLEEANRRFNSVANRQFGDLFTPSDLETIRIAKGKSGQLLELTLGMPLSNTNLDFEDGELKTNKCNVSGYPQETVFITQISSIIDELILEKRFEDTHLYKKIRNVLYVPVCKDAADPREWMFLPSIHIDFSEAKYMGLMDSLRQDYYSICKQLKSFIENSHDGFIHTANGTFLQVRSKDAMDYNRNYHPIYSEIYGRYVSNKNYAFYFQKSFINYIRNLG